MVIEQSVGSFRYVRMRTTQEEKHVYPKIAEEQNVQFRRRVVRAVPVRQIRVGRLL
jgi:hypothetical protein